MISNNWQNKLTQYIEENKATPFNWGVFDCCLFAAGAIEAQTGKDLAADLRGKYKTQLGAARLIKRLGFDSVDELLSDKLGQPIAPLSAGRGDIALIQTCEGLAAGVYYGAVIMATAEDGLKALPRAAALKSWRAR